MHTDAMTVYDLSDTVGQKHWFFLEFNKGICRVLLWSVIYILKTLDA